MGKLRIGAGFLVIVVLAALAVYFLRPISPIADEITKYSQEWPLPNYDYANTRATTASSINSSNVKNLQEKCSGPRKWTGLSRLPIPRSTAR